MLTQKYLALAPLRSQSVSSTPWVWNHLMLLKQISPLSKSLRLELRAVVSSQICEGYQSIRQNPKSKDGCLDTVRIFLHNLDTTNNQRSHWVASDFSILLCKQSIWRWPCSRCFSVLMTEPGSHPSLLQSKSQKQCHTMSAFTVYIRQNLHPLASTIGKANSFNLVNMPETARCHTSLAAFEAPKCASGNRGRPEKTTKKIFLDKQNYTNSFMQLCQLQADSLKMPRSFGIPPASTA